MTLAESIENSGGLRPKNAPLLFWNLLDPIRPVLILEAPEDILTFNFHPANPNIVVGGCTSGQLVIWDITEYEHLLRPLKQAAGAETNTAINNDTATAIIAPRVTHVVASSIEHTHKAAITDLCWIPAEIELNYAGEISKSIEKSAHQFVSASLDGQLYFWELSQDKDLTQLDLAWKPFYKVSCAI